MRDFSHEEADPRRYGTAVSCVSRQLCCGLALRISPYPVLLFSLAPLPMPECACDVAVPLLVLSRWHLLHFGEACVLARARHLMKFDRRYVHHGKSYRPMFALPMVPP